MLIMIYFTQVYVSLPLSDPTNSNNPFILDEFDGYATEIRIPDKLTIINQPSTSPEGSYLDNVALRLVNDKVYSLLSFNGFFCVWNLTYQIIYHFSKSFCL